MDLKYFIGIIIQLLESHYDKIIHRIIIFTLMRSIFKDHFGDSHLRKHSSFLKSIKIRSLMTLSLSFSVFPFLLSFCFIPFLELVIWGPMCP